MSQASVLYDALGPKARRRVFLSSLIAFDILVALAAYVIRQFYLRGEFAAEKWSPLISPSDPQFGALWGFLMYGLGQTMIAAILTIIISLVLGTMVSVGRELSGRSGRWAIIGAVELIRGIPVIIAIYIAAKVLPQMGVDLPAMWYVVIGLSAYNMVVIAEIIRAGLASLPKGQTEAAMAIGLSRWETIRIVLLPQAFRIMLPALISQLVVALKDTSLGFVASFEELLRRSTIAAQTTKNQLQLLLFVAAIYMVINFSLAKLAEYVQRRTSRSVHVDHESAVEPEVIASTVVTHLEKEPHII
jgi:glutamate transport system permease protein